MFLLSEIHQLHSWSNFWTSYVGRWVGGQVVIRMGSQEGFSVGMVIFIIESTAWLAGSIVSGHLSGREALDGDLRITWGKFEILNRVLFPPFQKHQIHKGLNVFDTLPTVCPMLGLTKIKLLPESFGRCASVLGGKNLEFFFVKFPTRDTVPELEGIICTLGPDQRVTPRISISNIFFQANLMSCYPNLSAIIMPQHAKTSYKSRRFFSSGRQVACF